MRRRILSIALLLPVLCPLAALATAADLDPNGTPLTSDAVGWLDTVLRAFLVFVGV
jgi:hypothetical protein